MLGGCFTTHWWDYWMSKSRVDRLKRFFLVILEVSHPSFLIFAVTCAHPAPTASIPSREGDNRLPSSIVRAHLQSPGSVPFLGCSPATFHNHKDNTKVGVAYPLVSTIVGARARALSQLTAVSWVKWGLIRGYCLKISLSRF